MLVSDRTREVLALEILELTKPPEPEFDEITIDQFWDAAKVYGIEITRRAAKYRLERGVEQGLLTKRVLTINGASTLLYRKVGT